MMMSPFVLLIRPLSGTGYLKLPLQKMPPVLATYLAFRGTISKKKNP
jgi:hypothetical protein